MADQRDLRYRRPAAAPSPVLAFRPAPFGFGQLTVGQTATQTFTLTNSGRAASGALTVTLPGSTEFTITCDACTGPSLASGKPCTVTVGFAPASPGAVTATLTVASRKAGALATDALGVAVGPQ